jgi:hypothetical protein
MGVRAADDYPSRPVRIVAPYGAGGSYDIVSRTIAQKLSEQINQQVVVDNRPGATGRIGMEIGVKSPPDGYTMITVGSSQTIAPSVHISVPYDLARSIAPIILHGTISYALVIHPSVPAQTVSEFVALSKAKPGTLRYGSGGTGGITHLAGELFNNLTWRRYCARSLQIGRPGDQCAARQRGADECPQHAQYAAAYSVRTHTRAGSNGIEAVAIPAVAAHARRSGRERL